MRGLLVSLCGVLLAAAVTAQEEKADLKSLREAAQAAVQDQDWGVAAATFKKITKLDPENGQAWLMLGYCLHADEKLDEALPVHIKAASFADVGGTAAYNAACVYALKGDKDKAIEWLGKSADAGFSNAAHVDGDSDMDALRKDERFVKIMERLRANAKNSGGVRGFTPQTERTSARLAFFSDSGTSPGQLVIDYGPVRWQDKFEEAVQSDKMTGRNWRLGKDFWTSLDTSLPIKLGGVEVPTGYYYLTLKHQGDYKFVLSLHDAAAVRKQHIDAFRAHLVEGGIEVPLDHATTESKAEKLDIKFTLRQGSRNKGALEIRFGGHTLVADLAVGL